jgi:hypothetical protein
MTPQRWVDVDVAAVALTAAVVTVTTVVVSQDACQGMSEDGDAKEMDWNADGTGFEVPVEWKLSVEPQTHLQHCVPPR